jgi:DNA-binding transcriptional ArsR family regulator
VELKNKMYEVEFDWAPMYELVASLFAYIDKKLYKGLDLGREWVKETESKLHPSFAAELEKEQGCISFQTALFIWRCSEERTPEAFLRWLETQSPGDLFELIAPWTHSFSTDIVSLRDRVVYLLSEWNEQYFRHINPAILQGLARDKEEKSKLIGKKSGPDIVDYCSSGLYVKPLEGLKKVVLIPQYHCSPAALADDFGKGTMTLMYASDAYMEEEGKPSRALLRFTRTIADESRLRILRFLAEKSRTFSEIVQHTGLAKITVFHHMVMLRGSGLVRAYAEGETVQSYMLRTEGLKQLESHLLSFLRVK